MKNLARIKPFLFENRLIIALDARWINEFGELPEFDVSIDNQNRLQIVSTGKIKKSRK